MRSRKHVYTICIGLAIITLSLHIYIIPEWNYNPNQPKITEDARNANESNSHALQGMEALPEKFAAGSAESTDGNTTLRAETSGNGVKDNSGPITANGVATFDPVLMPKALNYKPFNAKLKSVIRVDLDQQLDSPIPIDEDGYKLILFHTRNYGEDFISDWPTKDGNYYYSDSLFDCPAKCKGSMNRSLGAEAHGIIFGVLDDIYHTKRGERRYPALPKRKEQIWIAQTVEAPLYHNANFLLKLGHLFNWTFTYRLDSDIYLPYGYFYKLENERSIDEIGLPDPETLRSKKMAASLISNCGARSQRDFVIEAISKKIQVDRYGKCGTPCPSTDSNCRDYLAKHYKFFLAFENSLCQDYITEKFFDALRVGLVPVTFGLGDYSEVAPPHSYINSLDFPSISALTEYLQYLSDNDDEYLKYFHWKKDFELGPRALVNAVCKICLKLWKEPQNYTQQVTNFDDWWNHKRPVEISGENLTLGAKILRASKRACVSPFVIFNQGWLD